MCVREWEFIMNEVIKITSNCAYFQHVAYVSFALLCL